MNHGLVFLVCMLTVACFFGAVDSIRCHQCTFEQQQCRDPLNKDMFKPTACATGEVCKKTVRENGEMSRNCEVKPSNGKMECSGDKPRTCYCDRDDCNSSGINTPSVIAMGVAVIFMAANRF
ncbi:hypothetical protein RvY_00165 [Ramazzottius varieornatus]|uniref:Protein sleepless n=1 Tax=Ramazzottius varieornatus TaxID=947166 RepID=A0A1D1UC92_RAMVA|nr:hypothetical protein RvY_00165 [Ramazzottius varieornatus]